MTLKPYPGLRGFFEGLGRLVESEPDYRRAKISVEFYIISGGLEEIINNTTFRKFFKDVWGSSFYYDSETDLIQFPKNAVTFTDKTRFLFQINKGITGPETRENPDEVNKAVPLGDRRIPFAHMIYVGDGLTDVPCFSLVQSGANEDAGGVAFGIFHPEKPDQARWKRTAWNLMSEGRTKGLYRPIYKAKSSLRYALELAVESICKSIVLKRKGAL